MRSLMRHGLLAITALLLYPSVSQCDPPKVPSEVPAAVGRLVTFEVKADGDKEVGWQSTFSSEECTLIRIYSNDPKVYAFAAQTLVTGQHSVVFWTVGEKTGVTVKIGNKVTTPVPPNPPTDPVKPPPVDPPTQPVEGLYFLVVREDGPASQKVTRIMGLPEWEQLRQKKHMAKDKTVSEAKQLGVELPTGTKLPCVVTLKTVINSEGKKVSTIVRGPIDLPDTGEGVLKLPDGVQ